MLAAGFVLQVAAPTTYYPQSCSARLHVDVPQRLERPQRAAPQLPRAPPYLLTA